MPHFRNRQEVNFHMVLSLIGHTISTFRVIHVLGKASLAKNCFKNRQRPVFFRCILICCILILCILIRCIPICCIFINEDATRMQWGSWCRGSRSRGPHSSTCVLVFEHQLKIYFFYEKIFWMSAQKKQFVCEHFFGYKLKRNSLSHESVCLNITLKSCHLI